MICFAAVTPHSPLLLPNIGKENTEQLSKTRSALQTLSEELYACRPDTIVIISSHEDQHADAFSLNLHDEYTINFSQFGDLEDAGTFRGDISLMNEIQDHVEASDLPFTLDSHETLNYGTGVPLKLLADNVKNARIIPISISGLGAKEHVQFGALLKDVLINSDKRVAIVASGDLSHCLSKDAPLGLRSEGAEYDALIQEAVSNFSTSVLLSTSDELLNRAEACVHKQLLILFGILERVQTRTELLSYEAPFGVGHLVAQFHFPSV
ncbi:MAG: AmmeMemoRadiSam system protein B [bacterium]|jgi:MEMO1 family protein|nr:AmmeMemoRadiSam system protein B [bacterium]